jgi:TrpR family trp operon transcriptional repressor
MNHDWLNELSQILVGINNREEMTLFLRGLLTEGELEEVARRVQIVKKLKAGFSQHAIAKEMGVGVSTVTRGSKELQKGRFIQI